jgi:A/G-specific adenine glycosylase
MTDFAERLLTWFDRHGRKDLPWRDAGAYRVWISEIMLQQTQVQTVIPYYERFVARFPDVVTLADADVDSVLSHWSGLGYYARGRNLHRAARVIRDEHGGEFPANSEALVALPGIGRSTAGAILALAFGVRAPILDGNVKRVLARHEAVAGWPGTAAVANALWRIAEDHTPARRVADYTQAMMDLGATVCTRRRPACADCPVAEDCAARETGTTGDYPGRRPGRDKPRRETTMVLAVRGGALYMERRPPAGIWGGLWSLPEVAGDAVGEWCRRVLDDDGAPRESWYPLRHSFSHFDLDIHPVVVRVAAASRRVADGDDVTWYELDHAPPGGIAAPVRTLIDRLKKAEHVPDR